ncbi:MAG: DUF5313 family protein [Pseudonocardia sp.]|nr:MULTISPECIES: DUF5313 family protein [unclassified Pseudonocardia]MBN9096925.1 DUF5313 family protein [Pseudonocardia sp.]OJY37814.1 MAG: hypothetical protein BGP03_09655 [Pseudonocardia sp. 73-21]
MTRQPPGPLRWLWYALGGGLPSRYREWVLFDATCPSWAWRHFARAFVQMNLAVVPIMLFIPGPLWIRLVAILLGWLVALQYALYNMHESVEHRVHKAGYPRGSAQAGRDDAHADERAAAAVRYDARYRSGAPPPPQ